MIHLLVKASHIPNAGVGCFTVNSINEGQRIVSGSMVNRKLKLDEIPSICYWKYCVLLKSGFYLAPQNFNQMGALWYVNHAKEPNMEFRKGKLHARRRIEAGQELTLYYSDLLTHPISGWVRTHMV